MWYLSSLTRDQTHIPCIRRRSLEPLDHRGAGDLVVKSYPPLATPDCSLPGSSVHGILQARILEQVAFSSPGDLPNPGIEPRSPALHSDSLPIEL